MIILGIDPGIATTGYGIIEKTGNRHHMHRYGALLTPAGTPLAERLAMLCQQLNDVIHTYCPDFAAVEKLFFNTNVKTALMVGQARGVILLTLAQANLTVFDYTPLQVKTAVSGYGKADKKQVQFMIKKLLGLDQIPKPDDAADALAVALCHSHYATYHHVRALKEGSPLKSPDASLFKK